MLRVLLFPAFFFCAAASVHAQPDCGRARTNAEMTACAWQKYERIDAALNKVYQSALKVIADSGGEPPFDARRWEALMRKTQRAWIAFRDAECKELTRAEFGGGSGTGLAVAECMSALTEARIEALRERYVER